MPLINELSDALGGIGMFIVLGCFLLGVWGSKFLPQATYSGKNGVAVTWLWMASCLHGGLGVINMFRGERTWEALLIQHVISSLLAGCAIPSLLNYIQVKTKMNKYDENNDKMLQKQEFYKT